jgi:hypothetical protein
MFAGKGTASDTEHKRFDGRQLQIDQMKTSKSQQVFEA